MAIGEWRTNGDLIADVARLYLDDDMTVLDPTYGHGRWWTVWRPQCLVAFDIDPAKSPDYPAGGDFTCMPAHWTDRFDAVAFDPPYKLNGTATVEVDAQYGVHERATRDQRLDLIEAGLAECARVLKPGGYLLVKCQDQVEGGKVRWQTDRVTAAATGPLELVKVDAFLFRSYRPQPAGRTQQHARRNYSTLFVFQKEA